MLNLWKYLWIQQEWGWFCTICLFCASRKHFSGPFVSSVVFFHTALPHFKKLCLPLRCNVTIFNIPPLPFNPTSTLLVCLSFFLVSVAVEGVSSMELFFEISVTSATAFEAPLSPFANVALPSIVIFHGATLSRWPITSSKTLKHGKPSSIDFFPASPVKPYSRFFWRFLNLNQGSCTPRMVFFIREVDFIPQGDFLLLQSTLEVLVLWAPCL